MGIETTYVCDICKKTVPGDQVVIVNVAGVNLTVTRVFGGDCFARIAPVLAITPPK